MAEWHKIPEAGSVFGIRLLVLLARTFGRRVAGWCLYVVALYYAVVRGAVRRASRDYLGRVGLPATFANTVRHLHTFARVSLDRLFFLTGRWDAFRIEQRNHELLVQAARSGRGVLLLGAHLGSFEVMRCRAKELGIAVNVIVDFSNAERLNSVVRSLDPELETRLISLAGDPVAAMLAIRAAIQRGELVAILGDRQPSGSAGKPGTRVVYTPFLGADAAFPAGPWLIAHALRCPVYFVAGLYTHPDRYALQFELIADEVRLDRHARDAALARHVQRYAAMLEAYTRAAPLNWFNFFEFWKPPPAQARGTDAAPAHSAVIGHTRHATPPSSSRTTIAIDPD
jgi:predicted LPLAT superfamily acyltransferase